MCVRRLNREDVSDEELIEEIEEEDDEEDELGLEESTVTATHTNEATPISPRHACIDTGLTVEEKRANYIDPTWRMKVEYWQL